MKSIIAIMKSALPCPVDANVTEEMGECMVYDFNTIEYTGSRRTARMKTYIFAATMERGLALQELLDRALCPIGEAPLTQTVTSCRRNGGGWLKDGGRHVRIAYYDITMRA